jgi:hypothetical protein
MTMTDDLIDGLRRNGYAVAPGLLSEAELAEVTSVCDALLEGWRAGENDDADFWVTTHFSEAPVLYRVHNLEKKHPSVERLIGAGPFRELLTRVMGEAAFPTAFALVVKLARGGSEIIWHRDPIEASPGTIFNFSIFLDDSDAENGCFEAVPGSHLWRDDVVVSEERPPEAVPVGARRGDVLIHDVRILHGSGRSYSERRRLSICIEFQTPAS